MAKRGKIKYIKEVLMCNPLYFSVSYSINPWMIPGSANLDRAKKQWGELVKTYKNLGITVKIIDQEPNLPDMVFSTDQGIIWNKEFFVSNFCHEQRRGERKPYLNWFESNGYKIRNIPNEVCFEGNGECVFFNGNLFVGVGFRANAKSCKYLHKALKIDVYPLELINPYFYHLDTALLVLDDKTAFYYQQAFSKKSQKLLQKKIPNLIPFSDEEVYKFAANSVVTDHTVIVQKDILSFNKTLRKLGYNAVSIDLSEFIKSGGAAHCLTQILKEDYEN